ncbi:MAG: Fis family transcriptional regulator [Coxiella sp. RIFCSPHIGHO2_12_FULL_42_15]|nr:MAG: Fis family transcriptional regulator [Coxiella sp. RIFCSPHIGHO2_12_FULL_42_15]
MESETIVHSHETKSSHREQDFAKSVRLALQGYFSNLEGTEPANLYNLVLAELEIPLLKMVMRFTNSNQSKAAKILGISRGTLRKKLAMHELS